MANIRIQNKSDKQVNWEKAINFVPLKGELIIYENDNEHSSSRVKIGDGTTPVNNLSFIETEIDYSLIEFDISEIVPWEPMKQLSLTDMVTGNRYKLYVEDGKLSMEVFE